MAGSRVINDGIIEMSGDDGVTVRIYYDPAWLNTDPTRDPALAPLIDGPRGFCADLTNTTGKAVNLTFRLGDGTTQVIKVGKGDPVNTGPTSGRSRTAAQMAQLGFTTRGQVQVSLEGS